MDKGVIVSKILVIVPAFNEEESIERVLDRIQQLSMTLDVLVVNDGSQDRTVEIANRKNVLSVTLPYNLGIGAAMQTGYLYALDHGFDYAIQLDADGQHPVEAIPEMIQAVLQDKVNMVIGSRFLKKTDYQSSFWRSFGIRIFRWLTRLISSKVITDPTSGFRIIDKALIAEFANYYPEDYPEVEAIILAGKKGYQIEEVSVNMQERQGGYSSIRLFHAIYYMVKVILAMIIDIFKPLSRHKGG